MVGRTGVARLALSADVPVVPVAQWGPQHAVDVYHKRYRPLPAQDGARASPGRRSTCPRTGAGR